MSTESHFARAAAALDQPPPAPDDGVDEARLLSALRDVIDPEIGLDVVTLGLVYGVSVDGGRVTVTYTLTTRGCPMQGVIGEGIASAVSAVPGVERVELDLVWEPEWHPGMIREVDW